MRNITFTNNQNPYPTSIKKLAHKPGESVYAHFERQNANIDSVKQRSEAIKKEKIKKKHIKTAIVISLVALSIALTSIAYRQNLRKLLEALSKASEERLNKLINQQNLSQHNDLFTRVQTNFLKGTEAVFNGSISLVENFELSKSYVGDEIASNIPLVNRAVSSANNLFEPTWVKFLSQAGKNKYTSAANVAKGMRHLAEKTLTEPESRKMLSQLDEIIGATGSLADDFSRRVANVRPAFTQGVHDNYYSLMREIISNPEKAQKVAGSFGNSVLSREFAYANPRIVQEQISLIDKAKHITTNIPYLKKISATAHKAQQRISEVIPFIKEKANLVDDMASLHDDLLPALTETVERKSSSLLDDLAKEIAKLPKEKAELLSKRLKVFDKAFNNAVNFEHENGIARLTEIAIGPTPVFELAATTIPVLGEVHDVIDSRNKEERTSKTIKTTPVVLGSYAGLLGAIMNGFFGIKAMGISYATGLACQKIGEAVDNKFYSKGKNWDTLDVLASGEYEKSTAKFYEV